MSRKKRSDSKLASLSEEQSAELAEWLTYGGLSYKQARQKLADEWGVHTSEAALCEFYSDYAAPWKYARSRHAADAFGELMAGNFEEPILKKCRELAFDMLANPSPDVKSAQALLGILGDSARLELDKRKVEIASRRVALLEEKMRAIRATVDKAKTKGGLTPETLAEIEQQLALL